QEARVRTEKLGGHLATLTSQAENDFVMPLCQPGEGLSSWLGGQRAGDGWNWVTGEKWAFTNWSPGEPNNTYGAEYYLISWIDGVTWNDGGAYSGTFIVEWSVSAIDCDGNDICDLDEIAKSPGLDLNEDGVIDGCQCIADVVVDGEVNGVDLARILNDWGTASAWADIDRDGLVGGTDLAIVLSGWGSCSP
ncbi:MAG: lectin-like protein, partial [Planctomycetota bacterium]